MQFVGHNNQNTIKLVNMEREKRANRDNWLAREKIAVDCGSSIFTGYIGCYSCVLISFKMSIAYRGMMSIVASFNYDRDSDLRKINLFYYLRRMCVTSLANAC